MKIDGNTIVNGGFPPDEGKRLADVFLERKDLTWDDLSVNLEKCAAALLISAFFNGFLQEVYDKRRELLPAARKIDWELQFPFQRDNVARWMKDFKPYEA